jgi:hypothetical protein
MSLIRSLLIAGVLVLGGSVSGLAVSALPVQASASARAAVNVEGVGRAPAKYDIINYNGRGWCIADSGQGRIEHTSNRPCRADFTFTNPATNGPFGYTYYLIRINGGADCLEADPFIATNPYVYNEPCQVGNIDQLWAYHHVPWLINWSTGGLLIACNASNNSRLYTVALPRGCNLHSGEEQWARIRS